MKIFPLTIVVLLVASCGGNLFESLVYKKSEAFNLEQAKIHLDKEEYDKASEFLDKVRESHPEKPPLIIALTLGKAGLSFWQILLQVAETTAKSASSFSSSSGMDKIFDVISDSVFGVGEEREKRILALSNSIGVLEGTEKEDKKTKNFKCLLSGILVLPSVIDATAAMSVATTALETVQASVTGGGLETGQCPNLDGFTDALETLTTVQKNFDLVLEQTEGCSFLSFLNDNASLNQAQQMLKKLTSGADKGCDLLTCEENDIACLALQLPCIKEVLGASSAVKDDGRIDNCEILENCRTAGSCF